MNARIQVEHPVTEVITGVDLVAEQIAIAGGDGLAPGRSPISDASGCAIECRVNAEDPARDFRPSPGLVTEARWPTGRGHPRGHAHRGGLAGCRRTTIR